MAAMRLNLLKALMVLFATCCMTAAGYALDAKSGVTLPNPVLVLVGHEYYSTGGKDFTRYKYRIDNLAAYPAEMFAPAPELPPCGQNTKAARTWIDFYDQRGTRLYGFCSYANNRPDTIWFNLETGEVPSSWIYIEMNDRQTNLKYRSNLAETTL